MHRCKGESSSVGCLTRLPCAPKLDTMEETYVRWEMTARVLRKGCEGSPPSRRKNAKRVRFFAIHHERCTKKTSALAEGKDQ